MFHYDLASTWKKKIEEVENCRMKIALSMIPKDCRTLIDLGSGDGSLLYTIEKSTTKKIKCKGIERSKVAIKIKKCISNIEFRKDFQLHRVENQYDIVVSMAVFEHLKDFEVKQKKELIENLSKKYLLVSVPYKEKRVNVKCPHCNCCFDPHWHLRSYDISSLARLFLKWNIKKTYLFKTKTSFFDIIIRFFGIVISAKHGNQKICPLCQKIIQKNKISHDVNNDAAINKKGLMQLIIKVLKFFLNFKIQKVSEVFILFEKKNYQLR